MNRKKVVRLTLGTTAFATLAGCGGGGGVESTPPAPVAAPQPVPPTNPAPAPTPAPVPAPGPTPSPLTGCAPNCSPAAPPAGFVVTPSSLQPQRSVHDDAEYRANYIAAEYISALYALDNGWDGRSVLLGVLDDGVRETPELTGKISSLSRDFGFVIKGGVDLRRNSVGDITSTHGTPVATIIAGKNDGIGVQGLAPGATIVSLRVDARREDDEMLGVNEAAALRYAADNGIRVVNKSLGYTETDVSDRSVRDAIAYLARSGGIVINSAGNNAADNPSNYLDLTEATRDGLLFVGAISPGRGTGYEIASYSNRCGVVMDRCVVAIGTNVTHDVNGDRVQFSGTSSAAPQVSALAAMILSKWPQLSGVDAGNVILATARDIGDAGVDTIFGHGLIDARSALSPVRPALSNGRMTSSVASSLMVLGNAFAGTGKSVPASMAEALGNVVVLDAFGRDFAGDLSGMVVHPLSDERMLQRRVEAQANAGFTSFVTPAASGTLGWSAFETEHAAIGANRVFETKLTSAALALRVQGVTMKASFNGSDDVMSDIIGMAPTSDVMFAYSPRVQTSVGVAGLIGEPRIGLSLYEGRQASGAIAHVSAGAGTFKLGILDETGAVFGTPVGAGAMRFGDGARTLFAEVATGFGAHGWQVDAYASVGSTRLKLADDLLLTKAQTLMTGRFGVVATQQMIGGRVSVGLAQPLVVLSGTGTLTVGSDYDSVSRRLLFDERTVHFGGQIQPRITFGFEKNGLASALRVGAATDARARDMRAIGSWTMRF
ncbi:S8 family peptidase [Croceibacterium ferulae]|uniref:S8 family peptidase n=1 Tax=Croceibacterium ferulae TaxID=1854641 RepID=UPI000EAC2583|nr:S8 family peptidase [Croceibacterium ferulae]